MRVGEAHEGTGGQGVVSPLGGGTLFKVESGLRTDLGVSDEKGDREPGGMRYFSTAAGRSACPNGVRHHRVNALTPDPNRRG